MIVIVCNRLQTPTTNARVRTIADIARLAGVSKSTVSRALNDSPLIGSETKERIRAIAREHRFQMNVPARRLSLKQSRAVALLNAGGSTSTLVPDAFMLEIMGGISSALHGNDYDLLVAHAGRRGDDWARRYLESGRADGFILLSPTCTPRHIATLEELGAPFVVWGTPQPGHAYCSVTGDNDSGGKLATAHLLRRGRRRIGFIGGPSRDLEVKGRFRGYEAALRESGVALDERLVEHVEWQHPELLGVGAARALLERAPDLDGLVVNSDLLAIAAMDELREQGRRIPDDVAVVGYDDIAVARYSNPPLTTIRQNAPLAGKLLAQTLIEHLETGAIANVSLPAELVVRESA
jgi:DNA-binding LacI/PurR family transcriptional regulator